MGLPIYINMNKVAHFFTLALGLNPPGRRAKPRKLALYPARKYVSTTSGSITIGVVLMLSALTTAAPTLWELTIGNSIAIQNQKELGKDIFNEVTIIDIGDSSGEEVNENTIIVEEQKAALPELENGLQLGQIFARLYVPKFGDDYEYIIAHGTYNNVLKQAIGHYVNTAVPGQQGNFAIAGHRTSYGASMLNTDKLKQGDRLVIEISDKYYLYEHNNTAIVEPTDINVLITEPEFFLGESAGKTLLTLTSCHPKYSDSKRIIAFNVLVGVFDKETHTLQQVLSSPKVFTHYIFSEGEQIEVEQSSVEEYAVR